MCTTPNTFSPGFKPLGPKVDSDFSTLTSTSSVAAAAFLL